MIYSMNYVLLKQFHILILCGFNNISNIILVKITTTFFSVDNIKWPLRKIYAKRSSLYNNIINTYFPASSINICCVFSVPVKLLSVLCSGIKAMIANAITNNNAAILIRLLFPMVSYSFPLHATILLISS